MTSLDIQANKNAGKTYMFNPGLKQMNTYNNLQAVYNVHFSGFK